MTVSTPLRCSAISSTDKASRSAMITSAPRDFRSMTSGFAADAGLIAAFICYGTLEKGQWLMTDAETHEVRISKQRIDDALPSSASSTDNEDCVRSPHCFSWSRYASTGTCTCEFYPNQIRKFCKLIRSNVRQIMQLIRCNNYRTSCHNDW